MLCKVCFITVQAVADGKTRLLPQGGWKVEFVVLDFAKFPLCRGPSISIRAPILFLKVEESQMKSF